MRKLLINLVMLILAFTIQICVFPQIAFLSSAPNLLLIVLLQAILGKASALSLSIVIGLTSWMSIAKGARTEVRVLRSSEYVQASHCMGGSFFHILRVHLAPNFLPSILFMVIMNVRGAILAESTLSFLGLGLPLEVVSWGSMLSLSEKALLTGSWWIIVIPGVFLVATLLSLTEIGNANAQSAAAASYNIFSSRSTRRFPRSGGCFLTFWCFFVGKRTYYLRLVHYTDPTSKHTAK